jgi:hypothetical protein
MGPHADGLTRPCAEDEQRQVMKQLGELPLGLHLLWNCGFLSYPCR